MTQDTTTEAVDLVEAIASFVEGWNGDTRDGDTSCIAEGIRERFASLSHPDSRTEPQEVVKAAAKHMVERFLGWRLPEHFRPDAGISFNPEFNAEWNAKLGLPPQRHEPTGTNLFDYTQATEMVLYMIEGLSLASLSTPPRVDEGLAEKAVQEAIEIVWNDPHQRPNPHLIELSLRARLRERGYDITALNRDSKAVELLREAREQLNDTSVLTGNLEWKVDLGKLVDRIDQFLGDSDVK